MAAFFLFLKNAAFFHFHRHTLFWIHSVHFQGLVAGLGNPGPTYQHTRHNIGFMVLDALFERIEQNNADGIDALQAVSGNRHHCLLWKAATKNGTWLFAKPTTFMNESGLAISSLASYYRLPYEHVFIVHDELDLPFGRLQMKHSGGTAGHNGLNSIVEKTGASTFHRLRIGIGKPQGGNIISWVLSKFPPAQDADLEKVIHAATDALIFSLTGRLPEANLFCKAFSLAPPLS